MTRIVAGELGGRRLDTPSGRTTRPTSDRVREGLFNTLNSLTDLAGIRFMDLYAGSGAVGLEACSRGAAQVLLVESDPKAVRVARANIGRLAVAETVRLITGSAHRVLTAGTDVPYDVVFADPPYALADSQLLALQRVLLDGAWLAPGGLLVIERASRSAPVSWVGPITAVRSRRYGESILWYGQRS